MKMIDFHKTKRNKNEKASMNENSSTVLHLYQEIDSFDILAFFQVHYNNGVT